MSHTRILIVHADPSIAALMTSMLQTLGHKIDEAPNDRAAVRMLEHSPVDLVLAGADPDDADALEFLSYLRRKAPNVPVILLFSSAHPDRMREAQVRGAAAVLRFPVSANVLRAAVAQALGLPETSGMSRASSLVPGHHLGHEVRAAAVPPSPAPTPTAMGMATAIPTAMGTATVTVTAVVTPVCGSRWPCRRPRLSPPAFCESPPF